MVDGDFRLNVPLQSSLRRAQSFLSVVLILCLTNNKARKAQSPSKICQKLPTGRGRFRNCGRFSKLCFVESNCYEHFGREKKTHSVFYSYQLTDTRFSSNLNPLERPKFFTIEFDMN